MDTRQHVKLHNKFEITVCDAKTGEEKQKAYAYNVITNNYFRLRLRQVDGDNGPGYTNSMSYIGVGTGSGTPAITDTSLFTALFHRSADLIEEVYEYPTSHITRRIKINADEYNGQTFTEVGMEAYYRYGMWSTSAYFLCTHAMIQDAEGNQIAINKTDVDVVYITATFYCTFTQTGFGDNGIFPLAKNNIITKFLMMGGGELTVRSSRHEVANTTELANDYTFTKTFNFSDTKGDYENFTLELPAMAILDTEFNNHVVKNLAITGIGGFQFPDSSAFPDYEVDHIVLGDGDGETTEFNIKCPLIKKNSAKIYVADKELSASEYEVDYESNCNNSRENFYTSSMKADSDSVQFGDLSTRAAYTGYQYRDPLYWGLYPTSGYVYPSSCVITEAKPIWIDFGEAKECNIMRMDTNKISTSYIDNMVIECSNDNETWTAVEYTREETAYTSSIYYYTFKFPLTSARYWRAYIKNLSWTYYLYYYNSNLGTRDGTTHIKSSFFLGKSVPGLKLKTAPAAGETVEASYKLDVPYKTSNNIMRITGSVVLQRG